MKSTRPLLGFTLLSFLLGVYHFSQITFMFDIDLCGYTIP